ncbi:MAG: hypothetical protein ACXVC1_06690 [Tumebacillaceae bacterium]
MKKTVITLLAVTALQLTMVSAAFASDTLTAGQSLSQGSNLFSADGRFGLAMQGDGNLVQYMGTQGTVLWASGTNDAYVILQDQSNPSLYRYYYPQQLTLSTSGVLSIQDYNHVHTFWQADTQTWINNYYHPPMIYPTYGDTLIEQTDGNVVLYDTHSSSTKLAVWATDTYGH